MANTLPIRRRLAWQEATVTSATVETPSARTLTLDVPVWADHRAGQHIDIRLTAEDGYQAVRSYSISSAPGEQPAITVERVDDGEVSPFLVEVVEVADTFEVRGPIGGYFVLDAGPAPVLLVGGGSGIAPLRSMWRAQAGIGPLSVIYSARDESRLIYVDELDAAAFDVHVTLTRDRASKRRRGRIDQALLAEALAGASPELAFVCGPTAFVETAAGLLLEAGLDAGRLRTERFG